MTCGRVVFGASAMRLKQRPGPYRTWGMRNRDARVAGLLYLLAVIIGVFDLMYIPATFVKHGDTAAATAHNILTHQFLFRLGIVSDLVGGLVWLFVVLALYRLLEDVDRPQAQLMVILGAFMQVPLFFVNVLNYVGALLMVTDTSFLSVFTGVQRDAIAMLFLRMHYYELMASYVFAGLWLIPFGILVFKSRFLPRVLGVWLIVNGFANLAICFTVFLAPQYLGTVITIATPLALGEIATMLWLLIMGARTLGEPRRIAAA